MVTVQGMVKTEAREVELEFFLAPGTSGQAAAGLIATRLSKAGFDVIRPQVSGPGTGGTFLIEDALRIEVMAPMGMQVSLGSTASAPAYLGILSELEDKESFSINLSCAFRLPLNRGIDQVDFTALLEGPVHPTQMVESLSTQALEKGLRSERPKSLYWRPLGTVKSSNCIGFCATWDGRPGWGAVLALRDHR